MERRTLIRLLVVFGIGIPLLIEGVTFLGLFEAQLLGGDGGSTPTPTVDGVTEGEEILSETAPTETLSTVSLSGNGERTLTLTVHVNNTANDPYKLRLGSVTTDGGERIERNVSTGEIGPGEAAFATAQWTLPSGAQPTSVTVVTITTENGERQRTERTIELASS
ncbi:MAG: hypothetical protein ABEH88_08395 [Halobacteriales archaeon]